VFLCKAGSLPAFIDLRKKRSHEGQSRKLNLANVDRRSGVVCLCIIQRVVWNRAKFTQWLDVWWNFARPALNPTAVWSTTVWSTAVWLVTFLVST
jgi:hypothetical protein